MDDIIIQHKKPSSSSEGWVYIDWDGEVFLENNLPHDNFELYSHLESESRHVVWVRPYNGDIITSVSVPI